jgi:hypothetical protein
MAVSSFIGRASPQPATRDRFWLRPVEEVFCELGFHTANSTRSYFFLPFLGAAFFFILPPMMAGVGL